jgi:hypothetical protein
MRLFFLTLTSLQPGRLGTGRKRVLEELKIKILELTHRSFFLDPLS